MSGEGWFFDLFMMVVVPVLALAFYGSGPAGRSRRGGSSSSELQQLRQQYQRLQYQLAAQTSQAIAHAQEDAFAQLQPLLTQYPSVAKMVEYQPGLPAERLVALFTPLENLVQQWGYELIGQPWEAVPFDPQLHQPDVDDLAVGESVYVRFVGYRQGDRILCPARVSRQLPAMVQNAQPEPVYEG